MNMLSCREYFKLGVTLGAPELFPYCFQLSKVYSLLATTFTLEVYEEM